MKSVLISIQPQWCEKIANGRKTMELRKTKSKLETPFKCYIYCTKPKNWFRFSSFGYASDESLWLANGKVEMCDGFKYWHDCGDYTNLNGKVIGEFVCEYILGHCDMSNADIAEQQSLVNRQDIHRYGGGKEVYGWHISDLVIYDTPKELSEFGLSRPPQSWCYVEELHG